MLKDQGEGAGDENRRTKDQPADGAHRVRSDRYCQAGKDNQPERQTDVQQKSRHGQLEVTVDEPNDVAGGAADKTANGGPDTIECPAAIPGHIE